MKKIFRKHPESALITLAIVFLAVIIAYFAWGIGRVVGEVNRVDNAKGGDSGNPGFDIEGAKRLDLHGLVNQQ